MDILSWIKTNKLTSVLIFVLAFIFLKNQFLSMTGMYLTSKSVNTGMYSDSYAPREMGVPSPSPLGNLGLVGTKTSPSPSSTQPSADRKVIEESNFSIKVNDPNGSSQKAKSKAEEFGGFMVESTFKQNETSSTAMIVVRVPNTKAEEYKNFIRTLGVKVISENLRGTDVTDQYTDINSRLDTVRANKARFEEIMRSAIRIQDILEVQREVLALQDQIDSLVGKKNLIDQTSSLIKFTIYMSEDELALPYAPDTGWSAEAVFKTSIRALVSSLRTLASLLIWIIVYSIIWIPILIVFIFIKKYLKRRQGIKI